jgi:hypothetical protein
MVDRAKALLIVEDIETGMSLRKSCEKHGVPAGSFIRWTKQDEELLKQYTRAKMLSLELMAEELLEIADDGSNDWMDSNNPNNPGYAFNGEAVARGRLRVDTRKWYMSKLAPKIYGDKVAVTGGDENDQPLRMEHSVGGEAALLVSELLKGIKTE